MPKFTGGLGSRLYSVPLLYNLAQDIRDVLLYFPNDVGNGNILAGNNFRPFDPAPFSTSIDQNEASIVSGTEVFFEYTAEFTSYLLKFIAVIYVLSGAVGSTGTLQLRLLIRYPDNRGDKQIYINTLAIGPISTNLSNFLFFPNGYFQELLPQGSKLLVGLLLTTTVGTLTVQATQHNNGAPSVFRLKIAPTPDSTLLYGQSSRAS